jgi:hypothetical protein
VPANVAVAYPPRSRKFGAPSSVMCRRFAGACAKT